MTDAEEPQNSMLALSEESFVYDRVLDGPVIELTGFPYPLAMKIGCTSAGRLTCSGLLVGWVRDVDYDISGFSLSQLRLRQILQDLADQPIGTEIASKAGLSVSAQRHVSITNEHLQGVSDRYRELLAVNAHAPIKQLCRDYDVSNETMHRWLRKAEAQGLVKRST